MMRPLCFEPIMAFATTITRICTACGNLSAVEDRYNTRNNLARPP